MAMEPMEQHFMDNFSATYCGLGFKEEDYSGDE
jgi:hypothetical protein